MRTSRACAAIRRAQGHDVVEPKASCRSRIWTFIASRSAGCFRNTAATSSTALCPETLRVPRHGSSRLPDEYTVRDGGHCPAAANHRLLGHSSPPSGRSPPPPSPRPSWRTTPGRLLPLLGRRPRSRPQAGHPPAPDEDCDQPRSGRALVRPTTGARSGSPGGIGRDTLRG